MSQSWVKLPQWYSRKVKTGDVVRRRKTCLGIGSNCLSGTPERSRQVTLSDEERRVSELDQTASVVLQKGQDR